MCTQIDTEGQIPAQRLLIQSVVSEIIFDKCLEGFLSHILPHLYCFNGVNCWRGLQRQGGLSIE